MSIVFCHSTDLRDAGNLKISSAEREVRRAIEDLKDNQKAAYMEALEKCPDLVAAESRVDRFLRREKSDVIAAANLQARYWKDRKALFGERAFLPLDDLTGKGALTIDNINALSSGFMVKIPDDKVGRPSLLIDISRGGNPEITDLARIRCLFYWLNIQIAQNPKAQTDGFNMIRIASGSTFDRSIIMKQINLIQTSIPVKIYSSHVCVLSPSGTRKQYLESLMPLLVEITSAIKATRNKIHTAEDCREILRELEADGIPQHTLPKLLGGSWSYETFDNWFDLQRKGTTNMELVCAAASMNEGDEKMLVVDNSLVGATRFARAEERKERKRQLDVIYARKRREREKEDTEGLQEQCYRLNQANVALKEQGEKLERLLGEAQRMVELLEATHVMPSMAQQTVTSNVAQQRSGNGNNVHESGSEHQLLQLLLGSIAQQSDQSVSIQGVQGQSGTGSSTTEVLLQLLTLTSRNSNPNNLQTALQQITSTANSLVQTNHQSQDVLTNILCQVVALLEQQNQQQQVVSSDITTKVTQLLPLIQVLPLIQQLQWQQVQHQPALQPQEPRTKSSNLQEQVLRLLRNAGLS